MATKEAAERACKEPNPIIDGRKANVNLAILGAKPRLNSLQGMFSTVSITTITMDTWKISSENVEIILKSHSPIVTHGKTIVLVF